MGEGPISLRELAGMPVTRLKGVGDKKAEALAQVGVETLADLLTYYPRRYVDRTNEARIRDLTVGEEALVIVTVERVTARRTNGRPPRSMVTADVSDESGRLRVTFFNQAWRERQLRPGSTVALFGKPELFRGNRQMTNPIVDVIGGGKTGRIVPIYPQSEKAGLSTWEVGDWVAEALRRSQARGLGDPVPEWVLDRYDLIQRAEAIAGIHSPSSMAHMQAARKRLVLDELLRVQLALVMRKRQVERTARGLRHSMDGPLIAAFRSRLPFALTDDQEAAIAEIARDLAAPHPMHRLLQGDVGAGKTLVAVATLLAAVQGGHQGAFMAPTEVLAEQHAQGIRELLAGVEVPDDGTSLFGARPVRVELLTNRVAAADRRRILADLAAGRVDIAIGTHALIQEGVEFASLGVAVIDEQHRFGVEQRAALREKAGGATPDVLVMTATPIPRSAAMTVYGDLDVTIIRSRPAGRQPIVTTWARTEEDEDAVWDAVRREVAAGRQAYVVCPLIEESDKLEARSAEDTFAMLSAGELTEENLGLLHGRLSSADKDAVMAAFRARELDVLVATTVIEVGVDVPNATVMVILDADRFGIAQLHQLRGRVGRGSEKSYCYLVSLSDTPEAEARLGALVDSDDGFALAEVDLDLRGEGTIMGERQKGRSDLKLASLRRDRPWVERAREVAFEIVDGEGVEAHPDLLDELTYFLDDADQEFLLKG